MTASGGLTLEQIESQFGLSRRSIELAIESGVIRPVAGDESCPLFDRAEIEKLLASPMPSAFFGSQHFDNLADVSISLDRPLRVLAVEDDSTFMTLLLGMISSWALPIRLYSANNGFEGLVRMGQVRPDLVITDLSMPGMDGFHMLRILKRPQSAFEYLPFIALTALESADIEDRGGLPEGVYVLFKGTRFEHLKDLVLRLFPGLQNYRA